MFFTTFMKEVGKRAPDVYVHSSSKGRHSTKQIGKHTEQNITNSYMSETMLSIYDVVDE